jgi:Na+/H+ antiporter NhaA
MEADSDSKPVTVGAAEDSSGSLSMDAFSSERDMMRWIDDTLVAIFRRLDLSTG